MKSAVALEKTKARSGRENTLASLLSASWMRTLSVLHSLAQLWLWLSLSLSPARSLTSRPVKVSLSFLPALSFPTALFTAKQEEVEYTHFLFPCFRTFFTARLLLLGLAGSDFALLLVVSLPSALYNSFYHVSLFSKNIFLASSAPFVSPSRPSHFYSFVFRSFWNLDLQLHTHTH